MNIKTLQDLFTYEIQAIYDAETQTVEAMPTIIDLASNKELREGLTKHLKETQIQKFKLEKLCNELNIDIEGPSNLSMEGIIDSNLELLQDNEPSPILDAAIIAGAQVIEHYEIAAYGTAAKWAELTGNDSAKKILGEILEEEKNSDELLTQIAQKINTQAIQMSGPARYA